MAVKETLSDNILGILEIARYAPSVHNTQPWVVKPADESVVITIDSQHRLQDGDPTGRETIISLGIFAEALGIAAATFGLKASDFQLDQDGCTVAFNEAPAVENQDVELLKNRCTDRSIYKPIDVSAETLASVTHFDRPASVDVLATNDRDVIEAVAKLTSQGISLAMSSPGFRTELSEYLVTPWSRRTRGIATRSLYIPRLLQPFEPWLVKSGLITGPEAKLEKRRWQSAGAIVFICSEGDMQGSWFDVGRAYLRTSLAIEAAGLSQATSAAIVEASDFHEDIENVLGTTKRIQAIIRVGRGKIHRFHSPRVSADELLATSN
jgi:hypothetical protein